MKSNQFLKFLKQYPRPIALALFFLLACFGITGTLFISMLTSPGEYPLYTIFYGIGGAFLITFVLFYPVVILVYHFVETILLLIQPHRIKTNFLYDLWDIVVAISYSIIYLMTFSEVQFVDWSVQLMRNQKHMPIYTPYLPVVTIGFILFLLALGALMYVNVNQVPPLVVTFLGSVVYIGTIYFNIWTIQVMFEPFLILPMFLMWMVVFKTILMKVRTFMPREGLLDENGMPKSKLAAIFYNGRNLPWLALVGVIPILGIVLLILIVTGQEPSALIKAFTETSGWNLSAREAPPNLMVDDHYLCTVAARGHKQIVKPLRKGIRGGEVIIVNRQLMIANAFEQIIEEKTPRLHHFIRKNYDRYGFPLAKLIKTRLAADLVWILMKPAEWIFLAVIYLMEVHPEDRIVCQYIGNKSVLSSKERSLD